jgi:hypothetical protein
VSVGNCKLCGSAARVEPIYGFSGGPLAASRTLCGTCGPWEISATDSPRLDKESPETRARVAAKVREQANRERSNPLVVNEGLMLFCRHDRL